MLMVNSIGHFSTTMTSENCYMTGSTKNLCLILILIWVLWKALKKRHTVWLFAIARDWTHNPTGTDLFHIPKKARADLPQFETFFSSNTDVFLQGLQSCEGKTIATGLCESEGPFNELLGLDCAQGLSHIHVLKSSPHLLGKKWSAHLCST